MDKIELSKMLGQLRRELLDAQWEGQDSRLKFLIEDIEIELQIATTQEGEGGAGIKFWILNADAKVNLAETKTQKLKLKLKPVEGPSNQPAKINSDHTKLPS